MNTMVQVLAKRSMTKISKLQLKLKLLAMETGTGCIDVATWIDQ